MFCHYSKYSNYFDSQRYSAAVDYDGCNRDNVIETFFLRATISIFSLGIHVETRKYFGSNNSLNWTATKRFHQKFFEICIIRARSSPLFNEPTDGIWCCARAITKQQQTIKRVWMKKNYKLQLQRSGYMKPNNHHPEIWIARFCAILAQFKCVIWHLSISYLINRFAFLIH